MSVIKNKSTPEGREFWHHVETIAGQVRQEMRLGHESMRKLCPACGSDEHDSCEDEESVRVMEMPIPEDLKAAHKTICGLIKKGITLPWFGNPKQKELIERIAKAEQQIQAQQEEIALLNLRSHKWTGRQMGGNPANAESYEWVRFCDYCGIEDTCEDDLPACEVTRETLLAEISTLQATVTRLSARVSDEEWKPIRENYWKEFNPAGVRMSFNGIIRSRTDQESKPSKEK